MAKAAPLNWFCNAINGGFHNKWGIPRMAGSNIGKSENKMDDLGVLSILGTLYLIGMQII